MSKLPAFQFYPGDWMKDPSLRSCSHAAKGVLIDTLCLMFECDMRGVLITANHVWSETEWVEAVRCNADVTIPASELLQKSVIKVRGKEEKIFIKLHKKLIKSIPEGALYSFRMVRDEVGRQQVKQRVKKFRRNARVTPDVTQMKHPSSSSSSTSVINSTIPPTLEEVKLYAHKSGLPITEAERFWNYYNDRDWTTGKNRIKMRRWHGALANWKSRWAENQPTTTPQPDKLIGGRPEWAC